MLGRVRLAASWLLGYREVPFSARGIFRFEMWHVVAWAIAAGTLHPRFTALVAKKSLGAADVVVAVIAAAVAFANLVAVWWGGWARGRPKRPMLIGPALTAAAVMASVWFTPWTSRPALVLCVQVVLCFVCFSAVTTMRSAIWRVNYPRRYRARVTARFTIWWVLLTMLTVELVAWYLDGTAAIGPARRRWLVVDLHWLPGAGRPDAYRNVFVVGAFFFACAAWLYRRVPIRGERNGPVLAGVPTPPEASSSLMGLAEARSDDQTGPLRAAWQVLRWDRAFRCYMIWQFISGSATMMVGVPLVLILAERFEASYLLGGTALVFVPYGLMIVTTPMWGRCFDRTNILRFRSHQTRFWVASRMVLAAGVGAHSIALVLVALALSGVGFAGGRLAWLLGHMQFARREDDALYMGIHVSLTGLRGCVMPFAGLWLYRHVFGWHIIWLTGLVHLVVVLAFARLAESFERGELVPARQTEPLVLRT